jgi:hypothetical protein
MVTPRIAIQRMHPNQLALEPGRGGFPKWRRSRDALEVCHNWSGVDYGRTGRLGRLRPCPAEYSRGHPGRPCYNQPGGDAASAAWGDAPRAGSTGAGHSATARTATASAVARGRTRGASGSLGACGATRCGGACASRVSQSRSAGSTCCTCPAAGGGIAQSSASGSGTDAEFDTDTGYDPGSSGDSDTDAQADRGAPSALIAWGV